MSSLLWPCYSVMSALRLLWGVCVCVHVHTHVCSGGKGEIAVSYPILC
jgi:hypothetical protein